MVEQKGGERRKDGNFGRESGKAIEENLNAIPFDNYDNVEIEFPF